VRPVVVLPSRTRRQSEGFTGIQVEGDPTHRMHLTDDTPKEAAAAIGKCFTRSQARTGSVHRHRGNAGRRLNAVTGLSPVECGAGCQHLFQRGVVDSRCFEHIDACVPPTCSEK